eukprot:3024855-Rhodomonas_salina.3
MKPPEAARKRGDLVVDLGVSSYLRVSPAAAVNRRCGNKGRASLQACSKAHWKERENGRGKGREGGGREQRESSESREARGEQRPRNPASVRERKREARGEETEKYEAGAWREKRRREKEREERGGHTVCPELDPVMQDDAQRLRLS